VVSTDIAELRSDLRVAVRRGGEAPRCLARPCKAALEALTTPAGLRTEIALARLTRKSLRRFDTVKDVQRWDGLAIGTVERRDDRADTRLAKGAAKAAATGARRVLDAAKPVFRRDKSRFTRKFRRAITKRLGQLRKAGRTGNPPSALVLDQAVLDKVSEVPVADFPPEAAPTPAPTPTPTPSPTPTPDPRETSALTIDSCAATAGTINVLGKLTPPHPGTELTVVFTKPPLEPISKVTKTDDQGSYTTQHDAANTPGLWSVKASWPGDADTQPAESATCTVQVG